MRSYKILSALITPILLASGGLRQRHRPAAVRPPHPAAPLRHHQHRRGHVTDSVPRGRPHLRQRPEDPPDHHPDPRKPGEVRSQQHIQVPGSYAGGQDEAALHERGQW